MSELCGGERFDTPQKVRQSPPPAVLASGGVIPGILTRPRECLVTQAMQAIETPAYVLSDHSLKNFLAKFQVLSLDSWPTACYSGVLNIPNSYSLMSGAYPATSGVCQQG